MKKITEGQSKLFNIVRQFLYVIRQIIENLDTKIVCLFLMHC